MALRELILVRHGESIGNVAREVAESRGSEIIDVPGRDADIPLSDLGREQATALGRWLADLEPERRPTSVWTSTYVRARETAAIALGTAGLELAPRQDERLRDRELGVLDLLTSTGVRNRFPAENERRIKLGKFYFRPAGGESWSDLALRVRSFLFDLDRQPGSGSTLVVCHDAIVLLFRYVCEQLDEESLFAIARAGSIGNCSVTTLENSSDDPTTPWRAVLANNSDHLTRYGSRPAEHPGDRAGLHA